MGEAQLSLTFLIDKKSEAYSLEKICKVTDSYVSAFILPNVIEARYCRDKAVISLLNQEKKGKNAAKLWLIVPFPRPYKMHNHFIKSSVRRAMFSTAKFK